MAAPPLVRDLPRATCQLRAMVSSFCPRRFLPFVSGPSPAGSRFGKHDSVIQMSHPFREVIRLVGGFEVAAHQERLRLVLFFHPCNGFSVTMSVREAAYTHVHRSSVACQGTSLFLKVGNRYSPELIGLGSSRTLAVATSGACCHQLCGSRKLAVQWL